MDFLTALVLVAFIAAVLALVACVPLSHFAAREWRLMRAMTWDPQVEPTIGTEKDPAVRAMVERQRAFGRYLRRKGRSILSPRKVYKPVLTKAVEEPPVPREERKAVTLRRVA